MINTSAFSNSLINSSSHSDDLDYFEYLTQNNLRFNTINEALKKIKKNYTIPIFQNYKNEFESKYEEPFVQVYSSYLSNLNTIWQSFNSSPYSKFTAENSNEQDTTVKELESEDITNNYFEKTPNEIIKQAVKKNTEIYKKEIFDVLCKDKFETGEFSNIDLYMNNINENSLIYIKPALLSILSENEDNNHIIEGILHIFSRLPYTLMKPEAPMACIALFSHRSIMIKNKAIQVFEKWNSKDSVKQLENHSCTPGWVQQHLRNVIDYLNEFGK